VLLPDTPLAGDPRIGRAIEGCRRRQAPRALDVAVERVLAAVLAADAFLWIGLAI